MIPAPLVAPLAPTRSEPAAGLVIRLVAIALLVLAATGAWAWYGEWSPSSFDRWEVFETSATITFDPGTYIVYEEFPGASGPTSREPLAVLVRSIAGRQIDVTPVLGPDADRQASSAAEAPELEPYRTPFHEGRPTAWFEIDKAGTYSVTVFASEASASGRDYTQLLTSYAAVGPAGRPGWLGSTAGLVAVAVVPLVAGLALLVVARLRWPRGGRRSGAVPASV